MEAIASYTGRSAASVARDLDRFQQRGLEALAEEARGSGREVVVVLDNAPFHTAEAVKERRTLWEARGLKLLYLPAYCPHLNLIEEVWRMVKGVLMPRRLYDSVSELRHAVLHALQSLGAVEVHSQLGDT